MKKLLQTLCLGTLLMASISACSSTDTDTPTTPNPSDSSTDNTTPTQGREVLRVGMDLKFPPFSYLEDDGGAGGFEPAVAYAFGEFLGREVEIVDTDFSMLIPALETEAVDILIADMSATEERALKVDFSEPYRYTYTLALVNNAFAEKHNLSDEMPEEDFFALGGNFIGLSGTKGVYYPQKYDIFPTEVTEIGVGLMEVSTGMSDVLIASNEVHGFHAADPDNTMVYSGIQEQSSSSFAVRKGDAELLEQANSFIASMYEEGGLYETLAPEWDAIIAEFLQNDQLGLDYIVLPSH